MDEHRLDCDVAEVVVGLLQLRRTLDPLSYRDLLGSIMVEIDQGMEVALERRHRPASRGNVVDFPGAANGRPPGDID